MAVVQKTSASVNAGTTLNPALTSVTSGNTLAYLVTGTTVTSDNTPTDSAGQTWSKAFYFVNSTCYVACYYLLNANAGTHTLSWSAGGASSFATYSLIEFPACTALDLAGTLGTANNAATTLSAPSITTTNASDAVIVMLGADTSTGSANASITDPPTGYTSIFAQQNTAANAGAEFAYKEIGSTGSQAATWTFNADTSGSLYGAAAVAFKLGASGAALVGSGKTDATGSGAFKPLPVLAGAGVAKATGSASFGSVALSGAGVTKTTGSGALTVRAALSGAGVASASGVGAFGAVPVVTLKQYWLKSWQTGTTPASLQSGSNPMTVTAGSTLVAVWAGWDNAQIAAPVDGSGTFTTPANGAQFNGGNITLAIAYQANASGGSHSITAPNIAIGNSGEIGVWIYEVTNMPATAVVRNCAGTHVVSASQSWSQSSDSSPQIGDLAFALTTYENSSGQTSAGLTDPPSGWTSRGVNQDATNFIPTQISSLIVSGAGAQTAAWSNADSHTTEHLSVMLTMQTTSATSVAFVGAGVGAATGTAALTTRAAPAAAGVAGAAGAGALTVAAALSGVGTAQAVGSGSLGGGVAFVGAGAAAAGGAAALTTAAALAGAGSAQGPGLAALTVAAQLAGSGLAAAVGSGSLSGGSAGISFVGTGSSGAQGTGSLTTQAALAGGGFSIMTGAGVLTIGAGGVAFAAAGTASASGSASLTPRAQFVGSGNAPATGSAALALASSFVYGNEAVWLVQAMRRSALVSSEQRVAIAHVRNTV